MSHSYMGMDYFATTASSPSVSSSFVQSAGYPSLNIEHSIFDYSMWSSFPLDNSIYGTGNILYSDEIVTTPGNSGGPLFLYYTTVLNGQVVRDARLIGIVSSAEYNNGTIFVNSRSVRLRPEVINLYLELI